MTPFLLGVFLLCLIGSWASFTDRFRQSDYYVGLMAWVSVSTGLLFAWGCQFLNDKPAIFRFSLYYDVVMATAYYVVPLLFFGCRVSTGTLIGAAIIVLGLFVLHLGE